MTDPIRPERIQRSADRVGSADLAGMGNRPEAAIGDFAEHLRERLGWELQLQAADSKLVIVSAAERVIEQLAVTGVTDIVGADSIYPSDEWVGATLARAHADATTWLSSRT